MSAVLLETLVWTGVLIAAVLLLRRPVARLCGPRYAYALWALPLVRLAMPPLTLPAWLATELGAPGATVALAGPGQAVQPARLAQPLEWQAEGSEAVFAVPASAPADAGFDLLAALTALPLAELLLALWLMGAAVFLWRRFAAYFALRDALLAEGREVGRMRLALGHVRLVETPGTHAPLAFGVLDPVIALPPGFMALHDRRARDLALAHEFAHHRGCDLLVNVLVQPLFALHWWNLLGHYGWLALRRDQEAACDARVLADCDASARAAYARLIAGFAVAPNLSRGVAIAAPMACPVLGETSIIHRLRSLAMTTPSPHRRLAGRALIGAGLLALPLTASISYAAAQTAETAPVPPAPPAAPAAPDAPDAPPPPNPPEAPLPPAAITAIDPDAPNEASTVEVIERVIRDEDGKEKRVKMVFRGTPDMTWETREPGAWEDPEIEATVRRSLAEVERVHADMPRIMAEAMAAAEHARAEAGRVPRVVVRQECRPGSDEVSETITGADGTQIVTICQARVFAEARSGLAEARDEIASDPDIPEATRKRVLKEIDRAIAEMAEREG